MTILIRRGDRGWWQVRDAHGWADTPWPVSVPAEDVARAIARDRQDVEVQVAR